MVSGISGIPPLLFSCIHRLAQLHSLSKLWKSWQVDRNGNSHRGRREPRPTGTDTWQLVGIPVRSVWAGA